MSRGIIITSKTLPKIKNTSPSLERLDPLEVQVALGAEETGEANSWGVMGMKYWKDIKNKDMTRKRVAQLDRQVREELDAMNLRVPEEKPDNAQAEAEATVAAQVHPFSKPK